MDNHIDDATLSQRKQLATKYGMKYGIDPVLICAVAHHESEGWNTWAMRYEPAFFDHYIQPMIDGGVVHTMTEARARATSYGLMQVMGQTARELGFVGRFLSELCDPEVGVDFGCRKLQRCLKSHGNEVKGALLCYNGGSDPSYPDKVMQYMPLYASRTL